MSVAAAGFGAKAVAEASEAAAAAGQTAAVIKSTGSAAGVTAVQVKALSDSLAGVAKVEGETVQAGANMLLTFTNVKNVAGAGNDIFNQSVGVLTDLSAAMGTDPQTAAIQLGKALNDPVAGVSALTRVGVQFTDEQKNLIDSLVASGDVMGAQKVILAELNTQFGGSAKAAGEARSPLEQLSLIFNDVAETAGTALIPVLNALLPAIQPIIEAVGPVLAQVAEALAPIIVQLAEAFVLVLDALLPLVPPLLELLLAVIPILPPIAKLIALLVTGLVPILNPVIKLVTILANIFTGLLSGAIGIVMKVLEPFLKVLKSIGDFFGNIIEGIGGFIKKLGKIKLPSFLTPGSPSPFETSLANTLGLLKQISGVNPPVFSGGTLALSAPRAVTAAPRPSAPINVTINSAQSPDEALAFKVGTEILRRATR